MLRYPDIDPVAVHLGPLQVHWYGVMYVVGFFAASFLARRRAAKPGSGWSTKDVDDLLFWTMLGGILGGRLGYVLVYGLSFWSGDPLYPFKIWQGGMSFHGGIVGGLVAVALFCWRRRRPMLDVMDFLGPLPGLGVMAVRIGNFINSELWGKPTDVPWGFLVQVTPGAAPEVRHASQLYEAVLEGLLWFAIVWWFSAKPRPRGAVAGLALLWYGSARFAAEFLRLPDAQIGYLAGGWLTMGQVLSLPLIATGLVLLARAYNGSSRHGAATRA